MEENKKVAIAGSPLTEIETKEKLAAEKKLQARRLETFKAERAEKTKELETQNRYLEAVKINRELTMELRASEFSETQLMEENYKRNLQEDFSKLREFFSKPTDNWTFENLWRFLNEEPETEITNSKE